MLSLLQHGRDQGIDGRIANAHVVSRALNGGRLAAPVKPLLIAWRKRLIPPVLDHVEIEAELALIELSRVDGPDGRFDSRSLEVADISKRNSLLVTGGHKNFEGEGGPGRVLTQDGAIQFVAGLRQQCQRAPKRPAITSRAIRNRQTVAA